MKKIYIFIFLVKVFETVYKKKKFHKKVYYVSTL